jgi:colanic acid/amylovoran biosynthesis glycosyltransferase
MTESGRQGRNLLRDFPREQSQQIRVTLCSYDSPGSVGGPFSWLRKLLPELRGRGIECRCLFLTHYGGTGPVIEGLLKDGFDCPVIDCHDRTVDQVKWILEQAQKNPPDVFVPNLPAAAYHAGRWFRTAGIPTVGVLHSDDAYYQAIQDEFVFGRKANRLSSLVCVSQELERQVRERSPTDTSIHRIPYGVNIPPTAVEHLAERFRIAYVGRLAEEQKRISDLTRALIRVCRAIPHAEAIIYGDGPDKSNVERILAEEGNGVAVRLGGSLPNPVVQDELLKCDVVTLLSDYEGLPIALLEAMACGCVPVCLSMRSGISELIRDKESGYIVADRDSSFIDAMKNLSSDVDLRRRLGAAARNTVVQHYSNSHSAELWADHLSALAARAAPKKFEVPRRVFLVPRNSDLETEQQRSSATSGLREALRKARIWAGRLRRKIF